eukprot:CCRYP_009811-RA/>CCRYP_009811-RA protein AED:0.09 eAED:0.09 QI:0/-1/0/1/-1/1/1/0/361
MACYSVLRIGPLEPPDGNAALLRSAISSHFKGTTSATGGDGALNHLATDNDLMTISNRYFDAKVLLKGLHESVSEKVSHADKSLSYIQEDGIVLVFNSSADASTSTITPEQSFDSLNAIHDAAEQTNRAGELLRLCVGVSLGPSPLSDGTKKSEEEYSRRVLWCLDRGYEYVEADLTVEGRSTGHNERDKEGFARIVEAISSCMWSSHVMKSRSVPAIAGAASSLDAMKLTAETNSNVKEDAETEHDLDLGPQKLNNDPRREAAVMASLMNGVQEATSPDEAIEYRQQDISFHELEQVMTEAKRIREASQSNSMTDEERRQRAGDTAVRLMGLLEKLGFDEDEDDESSVEASNDDTKKIGF